MKFKAGMVSVTVLLSSCLVYISFLTLRKDGPMWEVFISWWLSDHLIGYWCHLVATISDMRNKLRIGNENPLDKSVVRIYCITYIVQKYGKG